MKDIYEILNDLEINYEKVEHKAVYTVEEAKEFVKGINGIGCKNLFLKDKNKNYYLYVLEEDKRANLKELDKIIGSKHITFANESELLKYLGITKGAVTPLSIINDNAEVILILDKDLKNNKILVHPNVNTATISIKYEDLIKLINNCGNKYIEI